MNIKDNRKAKTVAFESIKIGEVFLDSNDTDAFCMKILPICNINAINLRSGDGYTFDPNEGVEQVFASLVIN